MGAEKNVSEQLFEDYLISQGITDFEFEKEWEGIPSHPDYVIYHDRRELIFDVKEFEFHYYPAGSFISDDPYARIREKINYVRNQFKYFKDKPCCLVLYTHDPMVELHDWTTVFGAMYGDFGVTMLFNTETGLAVADSTRQAFLSRGKMFRLESSKPQNTTISALITLRHVHVEEKRNLGVIVWENAFANNPFPRDLFCGDYDERWGLDGDFLTRIFAGKAILNHEGRGGLES